jgi:hypothetical protein
MKAYPRIHLHLPAHGSLPFTRTHPLPPRRRGSTPRHSRGVARLAPREVDSPRIQLHHHQMPEKLAQLSRRPLTGRKYPVWCPVYRDRGRRVRAHDIARLLRVQCIQVMLALTIRFTVVAYGDASSSPARRPKKTLPCLQRKGPASIFILSSSARSTPVPHCAPRVLRLRSSRSCRPRTHALTLSGGSSSPASMIPRRQVAYKNLRILMLVPFRQMLLLAGRFQDHVLETNDYLHENIRRNTYRNRLQYPLNYPNNVRIWSMPSARLILSQRSTTISRSFPN